MGSREKLRRLRKKASRGGVVVKLKRGGIKAFDRMEVSAQFFLARLAASTGRPPRQSAVLDAWREATPESRQVLEEIAAAADGGFGDLDPPDTPHSGEPVEDLSE